MVDLWVNLDKYLFKLLYISKKNDLKRCEQQIYNKTGRRRQKQVFSRLIKINFTMRISTCFKTVDFTKLQFYRFQSDSSMSKFLYKQRHQDHHMTERRKRRSKPSRVFFQNFLIAFVIHFLPKISSFIFILLLSTSQFVIINSLILKV